MASLGRTLVLRFANAEVKQQQGSGGGDGQTCPSVCEGCGRAERVAGCNGKGRVTGGIGAVPGMKWWPIKAYRPCPAFVEAGGRYQRQGQRLEEFAYGRRIQADEEESKVKRSTKKPS